MNKLGLSAILCVLFFSCNKELQVNDSGNLVAKTVVDNGTLPSITVNGIKLHAQAFGPADTTLIVYIHGGPGSNFRYLLNGKSLAERGYRVVFYDQTGSGLSQRLPENWYKDKGRDAISTIFIEELRGVINHYKTRPSQKVILIGHSWGGMLATAYAGKYPADVHGLIVAEPGGLQWSDIKEYLSKSKSIGLWSESFNDAAYLDQFLSGSKNQHEILDYKLSLLAGATSNGGDTRSQLGTNTAFYRTPREGAVVSAAMFDNGEAYQPNLAEGISGYQKRVLFLYSSNNKAFPDSWAQKISGAYPNKELFKVNGVGHSGIFDQIAVWNTITEPRILAYIRGL